jgi:hypothetical protein
MKIRNIAVCLLFGLILLNGCAMVSDVVPAGKDTFRLSGTNPGLGATGAGIKTELYEKASEFCVKQGKVFEPIDSSDVDYRVFSHLANAELTFKCVDK